MLRNSLKGTVWWEGGVRGGFVDLRTKLGEKQLNGKELGKQRGHITGRVSVLPLKRDGTKPPSAEPANQEQTAGRDVSFADHKPGGGFCRHNAVPVSRGSSASRGKVSAERPKGENAPGWSLGAGSHSRCSQHTRALCYRTGARGKVLWKGGKKARRPLSPACNGPSLNISRSRKLTSKPEFPSHRASSPPQPQLPARGLFLPLV